MARAIGYIRVSTAGQAENGISLEMQRAKIEAYCALNDMELVEIVEDAGISAKNMNRPGLQKIMAKVARKEVEAFVVYKLDRLARNTIDTLTIAENLKRKGVALHSISEKLDTASAIGGFFFTLMAGLAEMERKLIAERTRDGLAKKRAKGEKTGGYAPFGYDCPDGVNLVENEREQCALAAMREMRAAGSTYEAIAGALNESGVSTKRGGAWSRAQVHQILTNPNYAGRAVKRAA